MLPFRPTWSYILNLRNYSCKLLDLLKVGLKTTPRGTSSSLEFVSLHICNPAWMLRKLWALELTQTSGH
jgi:hypothetical protein